jgi:hypothetical protein
MFEKGISQIAETRVIPVTFLKTLMAFSFFLRFGVL